MKQYPTISKDVIGGLKVYAFDKKDGSNVRVEWSRKNGFHRWGRRHGLLDDSTPILKRAPEIFKVYEDLVDYAYRRMRWESCTTFMEFHGPSSFAGNHEANESQEITIFDIDVYKHGLLDPPEFIDVVKHFPTISSQVLYYGNANEQFVKSVKDGTLPGMTFEGVICKASGKRSGSPIMFKVKSQNWLDRLKAKCGGDQRLFEMLA